MTLSNLRKTLQQLQPVLHNKKLNVGVVKEQVGVALTYPHGFWNLLATAVRITKGLLYQHVAALGNVIMEGALEPCHLHL